MSTTRPAQVEETPVVVETPQEVIETPRLEAMSYQQIIKNLIANGCKRVNSCKIKNCNCTEKDNYVMVSFTLSNPIKGFITDDDGETYKEGMTNILYTSLYAIAGCLKEDEELAWMANAIIERPNAVNLIFNGGTIDILQQEFAAGEPIRNPFSTKIDLEAVEYDHDVIVNHPIGFKLGKTGLKMADKLADMLLFN